MQRAERSIGRPGLLTARAKLASVPHWNRWREDLASTLEAYDGTGGLSSLQHQWSDDSAMAAEWYRTSLHAHMGGQLFVRDVEVPDAGRVAASRYALTDAAAPFFEMTFEEALEAFLARELVSPEEWAELSDVMRLRAFSATQLASQQVIRRAQELVTKHLADGGTIRGFIRQLRDEELSLGIEPSAPHYVENVARTNIQMAYGQGRLQQLEADAVVRARPFVQYRTARDTRVRPKHAALDGVVFDRSQDPGWRRFAPPLGYQCRCALVTLRPRRVDRSQIRPSTELGEYGPDPGWSGPGTTE